MTDKSSAILLDLGLCFATYALAMVVVHDQEVDVLFDGYRERILSQGFSEVDADDALDPLKRAVIIYRKIKQMKEATMQFVTYDELAEVKKEVFDRLDKIESQMSAKEKWGKSVAETVKEVSDELDKQAGITDSMSGAELGGYGVTDEGDMPGE